MTLFLWRALATFLIVSGLAITTVLMLAVRRWCFTRDVREFPPITQLRAADPVLDAPACCPLHEEQRRRRDAADLDARRVLADLEQLWTTS